MTEIRPVQLQFGVNLHADEVYNDFQPPRSTAFYPDFLAEELRAALASYASVTQIVLVLKWCRLRLSAEF